MATKKKTFGTSKKKAVKKTAKKKTAKKTVKKTGSKKKVTKKPTVKVVKKTVVKKTAVSKTVKKQMASTKKSATKANVRNIAQDAEITKLKEAVAKLQVKGKAKGKKKVNSKRISEYNLFIRKQIISGYSFTQAVKEWNRYQALMAKDKRRPSAYNQFIGSQMRLGKTFLQAVALWKLAKAGTLGKKGTTRTITKTEYKTRTIRSKPKVVEKIKYRTRTIKAKPEIKYRTRTIKAKPEIKYRTRTIKAKPEIKYRTRTKTVEAKPKIVYKTKTVKSKPTIVYRTRNVKAPVASKTRVVQKEIDYAKLGELMAMAVSSTKSKSISVTDIKNAVEADEEEVAFKIVQTYFKEIARFGFKKRLTLDEIINAYLYSLARVKRQEQKSPGIAEAVRKSGMRK